MSSRKHIRLRSEDMIGSPRVALSRAFAANPAVGRGLPNHFGSSAIVAVIVGACGVSD